MRLLASTILAAWCAGSSVAAEMPRVSLEIVTRPGLSPAVPQQWHQALSQLGLDGVRIRSAGADDEMGIETVGTRAAPTYRVTGILASDSMLYLPGGKFGVRETGRLRKWLEKLGDEGAEGLTEPRAAFGLVPRQLQQIHDDLQPAVGFSTRGMPADRAAAQIAARLRNPVEIDAAARRALAGVRVEDELQTLARGTALAVVARPAGLILQPRRQRGGAVAYHLAVPAAGSEAWPIGWKPNQRASEVLPALFEIVNVEISEIPVSEALAAIEGRLNVPFLYDRNALARHGADPASTPAEVPGKQLSYSMVLQKVLFQAKLRYELRVDEADRPFVWITTVKPAP